MKVKDYMTQNVFTANPKSTLKETLNIMNENGFRGMPVVDENGILVGIIVKHVIEKSLHRPGIIPETPVEWIMTKELVTAKPDDDIIIAALKIIDKKIGGLPVVVENKLVGIITDSDIMQALINEIINHRRSL